MASTGGVRLARMIADGKVCAPYLWIDAYNQMAVPHVTGTILTRVDASNHYSVTAPHRNDRNQNNNIMIAQIDPKTRTARHYDIRKLVPRETYRLMGVPETFIDLLMATENKPHLEYEGCGEALETLGLEPTATPREVDEAYQQTINDLTNPNPNDDETEETETCDNADSTAQGGDGQDAAPSERVQGRSGLHDQHEIQRPIGDDGHTDAAPLSQDGDTDNLSLEQQREIIDAHYAAIKAARRISVDGPVPVIANSAHYKLAGNSIVCDVLMYIYEELLYPTGRRLPMEQPDLFALPQFRLQRKWKTKPFLLGTLCSGYDSQAIACDMLKERYKDFNWRMMFWSEFDPESRRPLDEQPAVVAHNLLWANHPSANGARNLGDMTKIDWQYVMKYGKNCETTEPAERRDVPNTESAVLQDECGQLSAENKSRRNGRDSAVYLSEGELDLLTYSTPCQSISQAGKREGIKRGSGTRSSVLWSTIDAVKALKPKVLLQENVAALINQQNMGDFKEWCKLLREEGYENYLAPGFQLPWSNERTKPGVLNSKNYGVPQNRDRVYMVSIRHDLLNGTQYEFPRPFHLEKTIADVLEEDVSEQFFLKPSSVQSFLEKNDETQQMVYVTTDHKLSQAEIDAVLDNL